jgi:Flp pilus assembly protein TadG
MNKEIQAMLRLSLHGGRPSEPSPRREPERGQMLVLFALALIGLIGMVGLIIDGGDTALQRRDQQNVADAAAMAAGYASLNGQDPTAAAQTVASSNGYTDGTDDTTVTVTISADETQMTVDVSRPHRNYFSGILGFASWQVSATATVEAGVPNVVTGTMPVIFNEAMFDDENLATYTNPDLPVSFSEPPPGTEDVPQEPDEFNWTVFCVAGGDSCNASSDVVGDWIEADGIEAEVSTDWEIAPLNAGAHTDLFDAMADVVGETFPVAIVNDAGVLVGFGCFHLTGSVGGGTKSISGWFEYPCDPPQGGIIHGIGSAGLFGAYVIQLID